MLVGEYFGVGVDVAEKQVEGGDALREPALDRFPFPGGDQARQQIVREDALGAFFAAVDGEGDALGEEGKIDRLLAAAQFVGGQGSKSLGERAILRPHFSAAARASHRRPRRAGSLRKAVPTRLDGLRSYFLANFPGSGFRTLAAKHRTIEADCDPSRLADLKASCAVSCSLVSNTPAIKEPSEIANRTSPSMKEIGAAIDWLRRLSVGCDSWIQAACPPGLTGSHAVRMFIMQ